MAVAFFSPIFEMPFFPKFAEKYLDLILLTIMLGCTISAARRCTRKRERLFWIYMVGTYGSWWLLGVMYLLPFNPTEIFYGFFSDIFYILFYCAFFLALQVPPNVPRPDFFSDRYRLIHDLAPIFFGLALFAYFIVVPINFNQAIFDDYFPSFFWYVLVDLFLGYKLLSLSAMTSSPSWRSIYFLLGLSELTWAVFDALQALYWAELIIYPEFSRIDFFWLFPYSVFILATRVRPEKTIRKVTTKPTYNPAGTRLIAYGFTLPIIHFGGHAIGLFDSAVRFERTTLVVIWLLLFCILTLIQHNMLNRRNRHLEMNRIRNPHLLEAIGRIRSQYIETTDSCTVFACQVHNAIELTQSQFGFLAEQRFAGQHSWFELHASSQQNPLGRNSNEEAGPVLTQTVRTGKPAFFAPPPAEILGSFLPEAPELTTLALLPLHHGDRLIGFLGLANRASPYDLELVAFLEPFLTTCAEIIDSYRNQQERRKTEERAINLGHIIEESLEEIYMFEAETLMFIQVNRGACENLGYTMSELVLLRPDQLIPELDEESYRQQLAPLKDENRERVHFTANHRRKDGSLYPVEFYVQSSLLETRPVYVAMAVDIAERREMEAEKEDLLRQMIQAQKMETVGTLAGGIADDFNNALVPIIKACERMLDHYPEPQEVCDKVSHILTSAQRVRDMIKQLLTYSRRSQGKMESTYLQQVIAESLILLRVSKPANIVIRTNSDPQCQAVLADGSQMGQVILNLSTNAFHAMRAHGGVLSIRLAMEQVDADLVSRFPSLKKGPNVLLVVQDTGCGMDQTTTAKIFDPFFTSKPAGEGTGLGLSVIQSIIQSHSGAIMVESVAGQGTTFRVYLPPYIIAT